MTALVNLMGKIFGQLTVVGLTREHMSPKGKDVLQWLCLCDCGRSDVFPVFPEHLKKGRTTSCEICWKEKLSKRCKLKANDLTGQKFGKLTVMNRGEDYIRTNGKSVVQWVCECDCGRGRISTASTTRLKNGTANCCRLCGTDKSSLSRVQDLTGRTFGYLKVLKRGDNHVYPDKTMSTEWICECQIDGNIVCVLGKSLKTGQTKGCGRHTESFIAFELKEYCMKKHDADKKEYRKCINPETKYALPFDIYIPKFKIFIEVNGLQHYVINGWNRLSAKKNGTTPEEEFEYQKKKDRMKRKYARQNGTYIEIDLRKIKTTEEAIGYVEKIIDKMR